MCRYFQDIVSLCHTVLLSDRGGAQISHLHWGADDLHGGGGGGLFIFYLKNDLKVLLDVLFDRGANPTSFSFPLITLFFFWLHGREALGLPIRRS